FRRVLFRSCSVRREATAERFAATGQRIQENSSITSRECHPMKVSKSVIDRVGSWCALFGGRVAVAVLLACLVPAVSAQETQEQALARLDGILESLRDTRETTRTMNTLEAALEGSVSRFTCARLWGLGYVLGDAGAEAKFSGKAEVAFRVVTPFGVFQTYFA